MLISKTFTHAYNSELWSCATILILCLTIYNIWGYLRSVALSLKLTGPSALPFIGNCLMLKRKDLMKCVAGAYGMYGPILRVWVLLIPFFFIMQPDDLQVVLASKKHTNKVFIYRFMHNFLGNGLITSNGHKWNSHRKWIQPVFHLNVLDRFIGSFIDASEAFLKNLTDLELNSEINIAKYVNNCIIDVLNEVVLGVSVKKKNSSEIEQSPFRRGKIVVPQRFMRPWLLLDSIYHMTQMASEELDQKKRLNEFTRRMIQQRREFLKNYTDNNNNDQRKCLLDYMIEISDHNPDFTEEDIVNEACTFMLAGQDSVGAAVAFTIFLLAQNQDCQQKCYEELEQIFTDGDDRPPTMSDLREMRYMEMCIKEALRLYPSVPLIARKLGEEVRLGKYTLPAGSNVFICPYATHRLPHIYPDPEKFDPERFLPENVEKRHPYAFLPFSAGPRYCIGNRFAILEMKTILSRLLRSYILLPVEGKTTLMAMFRITLRASGGLWVRLKPRECII